MIGSVVFKFLQPKTIRSTFYILYFIFYLYLHLSDIYNHHDLTVLVIDLFHGGGLKVPAVKIIGSTCT